MFTYFGSQIRAVTKIFSNTRLKPINNTISKYTYLTIKHVEDEKYENI
jgi:hypothetical protein